ncbi:MAG: hypothetical protein ACKOYN_11175 [Planctomycetota bacterium]
MGFARLVLPHTKVETTQTLLDFEISILRARWKDGPPLPIVEVRQLGTVVFRAEMTFPSTGTASIESSLSSDAFDAIWIRRDSGGTDRRAETYLFRSTLVGLLPAAVLPTGFFEANPASELSTWVQPDLTYRYWITSGASSPVPAIRGTVVENHGVRWFESEPERAPTPQQLETALAKVRENAANTTESYAADTALGAALAPFLDLVYAGQAPQAWRFLRDCDAAGLGEVLRRGTLADAPRSLDALEVALREMIGRSPFIDLILRRNGGSIDPPTSR